MRHAITHHRPLPLTPDAPQVPSGNRRRDALWRAVTTAVGRPRSASAAPSDTACCASVASTTCGCAPQSAPCMPSWRRAAARSYPVTVLHGLGSRSSDYAALLTRLQHHCESVTAIDLPGHGRSVAADASITDARFMEAISIALDALLTTPSILIGHSLGSHFVARYATHRPQRVHALVMVAPGGGAPGPRRPARLRAHVEARSPPRRAHCARAQPRPQHYLHPLLAAAARPTSPAHPCPRPWCTPTSATTR